MPEKPEGGGGTPLYQVYSRPKGYGFWAILVLVWNWIWLSGERSRKLITLFLFPATGGASNWWEWKRYRLNISFQLNFTYSSLLRWIPFSTDAYAIRTRLGLKTGMEFWGQVWKRFWNVKSWPSNIISLFKWRLHGLNSNWNSAVYLTYL